MSNRKFKKSLIQLLVLIIFVLLVSISGYFNLFTTNTNTVPNHNVVSTTLENIPEYTNTPYALINDNVPSFQQSDYTTNAFETYSDLDAYGRCGVAYANICKEIMPTNHEKRESLSSILPSGWQQTTYEGIVENNYLYNRCHLIAYQLAGENANEKNLITGTRYLNVNGMLPFENQVDDYIEEHKNYHVLYRVTPIFDGTNRVASGVQMEAYSVEDNGKGICFNIYVFNVQPGIVIDYASGNSQLAK